MIVTVGRHVIPIEIKLGAAIDHLGRDIEIVPWADVVHRRCDFGIGRAAR